MPNRRRRENEGKGHETLDRGPHMSSPRDAPTCHVAAPYHSQGIRVAIWGAFASLGSCGRPQNKKTNFFFVYTIDSVMC